MSLLVAQSRPPRMPAACPLSRARRGASERREPLPVHPQFSRLDDAAVRHHYQLGVALAADHDSLQGPLGRAQRVPRIAIELLGVDRLDAFKRRRVFASMRGHAYATL